MKVTSLILLASIATSPTETVFERDLRLLAEQRDRALAASADQLNRQYKADLEALFRRATQADDLNSAIQIKAAMERFAVTTAAAGGAGSPIGTWNFLLKGKTYTRTFHANGTITGEGFEGVGKWRIHKDRLIIDYPNRGEAWLAFPLNPKGTAGITHLGDEQFVTKVP